MPLMAVATAVVMAKLARFTADFRMGGISWKQLQGQRAGRALADTSAVPGKVVRLCRHWAIKSTQMMV
jgi:hypothetical protein